MQLRQGQDIDLEQGVQTLTSTSTTRGAVPSLANALDDAKEDGEIGTFKHDEVVYLHELPRVVLEALLGNSPKSGIGDLCQQVRGCEE